MEVIEHIIFNIIFMPLCGSIFAYLGGKILGDRFSQIISSLFMVSAAVFSTIVFKDVIFYKNIYQLHLFYWVDIDTFKSSWSLYVDSVTAVMLVVITVVSAIVHIYSIGYMQEDKSIPRFMSYLSLFTFFMLMLVTSNNILQMFFGWEGVGLCSYLLIGFWYNKNSANAAAMKAFIVNRVGDFAFMLGIGALFLKFDSIYFQDIFLKIKEGTHNVDLICLLLFIGAMGKSAQIGLHTWLPDAMEGPTPVSALIHAATMVTAGVFLVVRFSSLFELSPYVLNFITYIGSATAIFAATIALVQNDIKKIIAYSTCSQLGYMFFACGIGAYQVALFHLMTHAFFKALLFLGAGNVIYSIHHEQDITKMGGLWRKIPITYALMLIGSFALAGVYPFSGYFSKDLILEIAFAKNTESGTMAFTLGLLGAFCTAFYSWRLLFLTFHGKCKNNNAHEVPKIMTLPLFILGLGALLSGVLAVKFGILTEEFWNNSLVFSSIIQEAHKIPSYVKILPFILTATGIFIAYLFYIARPEIPKIFAHSFAGLYLLLQNKYYIDEIYNFVFIRPYQYISTILWRACDEKAIDGMGPNGALKLSQKLSEILSNIQTGYVYHYILVMVVSLVGIITWYVLV